MYDMLINLYNIIYLLVNIIVYFRNSQNVNIPVVLLFFINITKNCIYNVSIINYLLNKLFY